MDENLNTMPEGGPEEGETKKKKSAKREALEWVQAILIAVVIAFLVRTFLMTVVRVDGESMMDTLHHNERLIVWKLGYEPETDDIIIFHPRCNPKSYYVKRVIALEGQTVYIDYDENAVYVDGEKLDEPYIRQHDADPLEVKSFETEWTVPEGCVFVMGDNRNNSSDSRNSDVGFVTKESILGKVLVRFWPFNKIGTVK